MMRFHTSATVGGDFDLRKLVPAGIELSWPPSNSDVSFCYVCTKLNTSPTLLRPCDHLICQSCARCSATTSLCPLCRAGVTGSDCDVVRLKRLREQAIAKCTSCGWQGGYDHSLNHKCRVAAESRLLSPNGAAAERRTDVTHILWDLDNIQPPQGQLVDWYIAVARKLEQLKFANRFTIKGALYFRTGTPSHEIKLAAEKLRLQLRPAALKPEATDRLISIDIQAIVEASKHTPVKPKVVVISSDTDCIPDVRSCEQAEVNTCVVHNAGPNSQHEKLLQYQPTYALRIQEIIHEQHHQAAAATIVQAAADVKTPPPSASKPQIGDSPSARAPTAPLPIHLETPQPQTRNGVDVPSEQLATPVPTCAPVSLPGQQDVGRAQAGDHSSNEPAADHSSAPPENFEAGLPATAVDSRASTPPEAPVPAPVAAAEPHHPTPAKTPKKQGAKEQPPPAVSTKPTGAPAPKAPLFVDGLVMIDGKAVVTMDLLRNDGYHAVQNGERSPHLCTLKAPHDPQICTLLHYLETKPKTPTKAAPKSWGGVASTPPPKPQQQQQSLSSANPKPISKVKAKEERLYNVDNELVPESRLIRNGAIEYLESNPHAKGRLCTNQRPHEAKACTFIHFKKVMKK